MKLIQNLKENKNLILMIICCWWAGFGTALLFISEHLNDDGLTKSLLEEMGYLCVGGAILLLLIMRFFPEKWKYKNIRKNATD